MRTTSTRPEAEAEPPADVAVPPGQEQAAPNHRAFPALDGVRGLAVLAVVATHSAYQTGRYEVGPFDGVLARLDFGVALFFLLSGFLLFRPWLEAAVTGRPSPDLRVYFWRRGLRILPAYWIAVAVAFAAVDRNRGHLDIWDYVRHATLTEGYWLHGFRPGLTQLWSLCVEAAFYVVLPLFGWLSVRMTRRYGWQPKYLLGGCALLGAVTVGWDVLIFNTGWFLDTTTPVWLPAYLDWFAVGMAMAVASVHTNYHRVEERSRWSLVDELGANPWLCWVMAAALYAIAVTPVAGPKSIGLPTVTTAICKSLLYALIAALVLWPTIFGSGTAANAVFGQPWVRRLGIISYGVFLLHLAILQAVAVPLLGYQLFHGSVVAVFLTTLAISIVAAGLSYRLVELPASRLRGRVRPAGRSRPDNERPDRSPVLVATPAQASTQTEPTTHTSSTPGESA